MNRSLLRLRIACALAALVATTTPLALFAHDHPDARSREELVDLSGRWRFSIGDDRRWAQPDFDDDTWSRIYVPAYWEEEGYEDYNGYAWYRRTFSFRDDPNQPMFLLLGRIDDTDEVYVNGTKVGGHGSFPPNYVGAWTVDRIYAIPPGLLRKDRDNVIAVRVYDGAGGGGIVGDRLGIYTSKIPLPEINLTGTWKFQAGDDPAWKEPAADDSAFTAVQVPGYWETAVGELDGYGWYRKAFKAEPHAQEETLVLMLGKIDDTDEVYLNGIKVGGTGNLDDTDRHNSVGYHDQMRGYYFSSTLLKEENVVAVRVHDHGGRGGIYEGPLGIISQDRYIEYWETVRRDRGTGRALIRFFRQHSH